MNALKIFSVTALAAMLASCASMGGDVPSLKKMLDQNVAQNGRACIRKSEIRGYGVLKGDIVSIDATQNYYLATVLPGCTDLQTSMRAYFSSDFYEVCGGKMDKMVTGENQCTIEKIYEFENREQAMSKYDAIVEKRNELKASDAN